MERERQDWNVPLRGGSNVVKSFRPGLTKLLGLLANHPSSIFYCTVQTRRRFLKNSVDSYQRLIQPLETGTGVTFRSSRVRDEVTARMPDAGKGKEDTAMALVMVTDGPDEDFIIYSNLKTLTY
ncbi:hypothetical protein BOTCAL_0374g00060 [Botryotinia calthae]|uniref:Uncharacterized protein n=1 Tax=Botryotinia calthae TaxID=38488 RepID=A0A4Y8CTH0_9HELO|nr:hypothetical protein BOTCAL_0374g00060 [Botryotinia calthae]